MQVIETELLDCYIIEPDRFGDSRGYFSPFYINNKFKELGFQGVTQASRSKSSKGVLRGLHYQENPKCQAKIVEVIKGSAYDVVVDLRKDSKTYKKWIKVLLTENNNRQLYVPRGFAHGFVVLSETATFCYKCDELYHPEDEGGLMWNDPEVGIDWPYEGEVLLSEKDKRHPSLKESGVKF